MSFYSFYPPVGAGGNASIGINGNPAPTESTEVGGINPLGNLQPLQTDASGNLLVNIASETGAPFHVIVDSSALPTGASTSALQTSGNASLTSIDGKIVHVDTGNVTVIASALPTGAATSALQTSGNASLTSINANQTNGTQITQISGTVPLPTGASTAALQSNVQSAPGTPQTVAVTVQGNASGVALPVSAASLPLPTGAATSANQTNASQKTQIVDGSGNVIASTTNALNVDVINFPATQPVSGTITVVQPTGTNLHAVIDSGTITVTQATGTNLHAVVDSGTITANIGTTNGLALDASVTGLQVSQGSTTSGEKGTLTMGAVTTAAPTYTTAQTSPLSLTTTGALRVADSGGNPGSSNGRALANAPTVTTYGTPVTSAAYTTIIASTTSATNMVEIFDSSGVALKFAVGAAASEVDQFVIYPGGNGQVPLSIPAGSRISYKAVSTSASGASAFNVLNLYT